VVTRLGELHAAYRTGYRAYYERHADESSPAMRGADPAIVLVPGVGMFSFGADSQTARVAGEFYVNAINVMAGAESVSAYCPIPESEKFRIEYWELEEAKLRRRPKPRPLATRVALVTGGGSGIGRATAQRLATEGACVVIADRDGDAAAAVAAAIGSADAAVAATADVTDEDSVAQAFAVAALAFGGVDLVVNNAGLSISKPLAETTTADWDIQHDVMAKGSFLVSRGGGGSVPALTGPAPAEEVSAMEARISRSGPPSSAPLSHQDVELLRLLAQGLPLVSVARRMRTSERTVRRRTRAICHRLGVGASIQAVVWAAHEGLL
jgi:DNA-binding CsgD family transcriptional regulator